MLRLALGARHLVVALLFVAMALVWTWPLPSHLASHLPGEPGDNFAFLWNVWWMREALGSSAVGFFQTDRLFAPFGIDLTLHTHTALSSWLAGSVLAKADTLLAQNVVILGSLALNGFAMYLLAWDRTNDWGASVAAGVIFAGAPYLSTHLLGHFNLICAWGLPLFLLCLLRGVERDSWTDASAAGVCLVAIAYTDYYYLVYSLVLGAGFALSGVVPITTAYRRVPVPSWVTSLVIGFLILDAVLVAAILVTGGFEASIGGVRVVATSLTNPLAGAWLLIATLALGGIRARPSLGPVSAQRVATRCRTLSAMAVVASIGIGPLLVRAWALLQRGDYVAPATSWRSSPAGVDLATLWLGNPSHPLTGNWTRAMYALADVNRMEGVAWIGLAPTALLFWAFVRDRRSAEGRRWLAVAGVFFVWALGPWLRIGGFNTGLLLPQSLLGFVPLLSNARMPGRAMVVVGLAVAMLAATRLSRLPRGWRRSAVAAVVVLTVLDYVPAPFPLTLVETPALYARLRDLPPGAVCELPMGIRDGFGVIGTFDDRVLTYQMVHGRPIVGGFAARVPASIKEAYENAPVLRSLWRLSRGEGPDPRDADLSVTDAGAALNRQHVAAIVLNRATASGPLIEYLERSLPMTLVATEEERELYSLSLPASELR